MNTTTAFESGDGMYSQALRLAEVGVLAGMLTGGADLIEKVRVALDASSFPDEPARNIFESVIRYHDGGRSVSVETVFRDMNARGQMDRAGQEYLAEIASTAPDASQVESYVAVLDGAARRTEAPKIEHLTDLGNARRFVREHGSQVKYVPAWGKWLVWDGTRWAPDELGAVERMAKQTVRSMHEAVTSMEDRDRAPLLSKHAFKSEAESRIRAMISLARSEEGIPIRASELDADPWKLNVSNGTLDLCSGRLLPPDPVDLITKLAPVQFDVGAKAPTWDRFLDRIMDGRAELVSFLRRAVGYSMTGLTTEQVLLFAYGTGSNGKSTFFDLLRDLLGEYAIQSEPSLLLDQRNESHPTGIADLAGVRLVVTTEVKQGRRMNEVLVKQLTGGDNIRARRMRQDFFEFKPTHQLCLQGNHRPVVKGTDHAVWRRIRLVPFSVTITDAEKDRNLPDKLRKELPGILAWAVRGCLEWQEIGLAAPEEVRTATSTYRQAMDVLGGFFDEECVIGEGHTEAAGKLYEAFKIWADRSGERKISQRAFGESLQEREFTSRQHPRTRQKMYKGIALRSSAKGCEGVCGITSQNGSHVEGNLQAPSHPFAPPESQQNQGVSETDCFADAKGSAPESPTSGENEPGTTASHPFANGQPGTQPEGNGQSGDIEALGIFLSDERTQAEVEG